MDIYRINIPLLLGVTEKQVTDILYPIFDSIQSLAGWTGNDFYYTQFQTFGTTTLSGSVGMIDNRTFIDYLVPLLEPLKKLGEKFDLIDSNGTTIFTLALKNLKEDVDPFKNKYLATILIILGIGIALVILVQTGVLKNLFKK